jgi:hypothetical protein
MGTFLVSWQMGTGLKGEKMRATGTRAWVGSLFAGPFDRVHHRKLVAAAI